MGVVEAISLPRQKMFDKFWCFPKDVLRKKYEIILFSLIVHYEYFGIYICINMKTVQIEYITKNSNKTKKLLTNLNTPPQNCVG